MAAFLSPGVAALSLTHSLRVSNRPCKISRSSCKLRESGCIAQKRVVACSSNLSLGGAEESALPSTSKCTDELISHPRLKNEPAFCHTWRTWAGGRLLAILLATFQAVAPIPLDGDVFLWGAGPAEAVLYSPDTKVPRSAEVALRRAIPAVNTAMKKMQESLEDIFYLLRIPQRKPYGKYVCECPRKQ